jgi:hypothetical protein
MFHYDQNQNIATPQVWDIVNSYVENQPQINFIMVDYDNSNVVRNGVSLFFIFMFEIFTFPHSLECK